MNTSQVLKQLRQAGWVVEAKHQQVQHYECVGTGMIGQRTKSTHYVAKFPSCKFRLEFYSDAASSVESQDSVSCILVLHPDESYSTLGVLRAKTVKRAIAEAIKAHDCLHQSSRKPSMDALFDGSDAHRLIGGEQQ